MCVCVCVLTSIKLYFRFISGRSCTGGLKKTRPWRGRCRAGYSNTGGPPLPRKRAPLHKKVVDLNQEAKLKVLPFFFTPYYMLTLHEQTPAQHSFYEYTRHAYSKAYQIWLWYAMCGIMLSTPDLGPLFAQPKHST